MSYGTPEWQGWVLPEEEAIRHIKFAYVWCHTILCASELLMAGLPSSYDHGIQTFDTADVYSYGESERILGKAIEQLNLPRDEIVVMTKVCLAYLQLFR